MVKLREWMLSSFGPGGPMLRDARTGEFIDRKLWPRKDWFNEARVFKGEKGKDEHTA